MITCPICHKDIPPAFDNGFPSEKNYVCATLIDVGSGVTQSHFVKIITTNSYFYTWYAPPYQILTSPNKSSIFVLDAELLLKSINSLCAPQLGFHKKVLAVSFEMKPDDPEKMAARIKTWITFS